MYTKTSSQHGRMNLHRTTNLQNYTRDDYCLNCPSNPRTLHQHHTLQFQSSGGLPHDQSNLKFLSIALSHQLCSPKPLSRNGLRNKPRLRRDMAQIYSQFATKINCNSEK
ncbi:hypothetical protein M758_2G052400 [Ceratodon purpureus]|uniref:Uncharacterized protein n=1 Tax=Ceratodon purpureus TaxID=3225 RepID=A0A8T0IS37_CERPU|nr:hypothetical protein KC19_2G053300 [Ceratodon purpureus]KAG0625406.1 hypothetical protein M758_2G052400 [Ceratodon purpureus]